MVKESKYVYKGEKSSLILPMALIVAVLGITSYFSIVAGGAVLLIYILIFISKTVKVKAFLKNTKAIDKEENIEVFAIVRDLSDFFNINTPKIGIIESAYVEVFTLGVKNPYSLIVSTTALKFLNKKELTFAIGQELGNIHRGKVTILSLISPTGDIGFMSNLFFGKWQKKVEFASDRLGLLMNADIDSAISVLIKACYDKNDLRRLDIYNTLRVITSLKRSQLESLNTMLDLDYCTIKRIINLIRYSRSKEYRNIVATAIYGLYSKDTKIPIGFDKDDLISRPMVKEAMDKEEINLIENKSSDETKVFTQSQINEIKNRNIKLSNDIIKKHSLQNNIKDKNTIGSPDEKIFNDLKVPKTNKNCDQGGEYDEFYEEESSNTKKLIIILSVLLLIFISGMLYIKNFVLTKPNETNAVIIQNNKEKTITKDNGSVK